MKKLLTVLLVAAMALSLLPGMTLAEGKTLTIAQTLDTSTMDPQKQGAMSPMNVLINMFDTLVFRDAAGNLIPSLATEWEAIDDVTWQFKLREGVTFHDGDVFNAEDAKFSLERLIDPDTASPIVELAALDHVDIVDEYTINLVLKHPDPIIPNKLVMFGGVMLSKEYTEAHEADYLALNPNGTGPYKFVSWHKDSSIVMAGNENYWRGAPAFDELIFRIIPNQADMLAALRTGEIDMTNSIPWDLAKSVENDPDITITIAESIRVNYVPIYQDIEPFGDKLVRQAVNYAVDKQGILDALYGGNGRVLGTFVPSQNFGFDPSIEPYPYDPQKAKELLAEAGYPDGFEATFNAVSTSLMEIQAIAGFLEEVGIKIDMNVIDSSTQSSMRAARTNGPLYFESNTGWTMDAMSNYQSWAKSDRRYWLGGTPELDAVVDIEETSVDPDVRTAAFKEGEAIMHEEALHIFLWQLSNFYAVRNNVTYTPNVIGLLWLYDVQPAE